MKVNSLKFHIGFWIVFIVINTILGASYKNEFIQAFVIELISLPMRLTITYLNYFLLLPLLIRFNKIGKYVLWTLLSLIVSGFLQRIIDYSVLSVVFPEMTNYGLWIPYKFFKTIFVIGIPVILLIGIVSLSKMAELQKKTKTLENEKLESELKYLKSQINPHFLFNTLNNIYSLSLKNSKKTPELILKLSDFLSFSLYESDKKFITLEKEISLINDYIELEKSRFEDRVKINVSLPENTYDTIIPPLILVPFVENAFKHSLKNETTKANIDINLVVDVRNLKFTVVNSKPKSGLQSISKNGLGLVNIQKRLNIIYNKDFSLEINENDENFEIVLKIKFS
jgi:sensor histidine kinase YesM